MVIPCIVSHMSQIFIDAAIVSKWLAVTNPPPPPFWVSQPSPTPHSRWVNDTEATQHDAAEDAELSPKGTQPP